MIDAAQRVCRALGLIGLVSFDFLLSGGEPNLLEVNPRPGATLDVFDDAEGLLFRAHLAACAGLAGALPAARGCRSAAILYAGKDPITPGDVAWPAWAADRPWPGTGIPAHRPIATVLANDATAEGAELNCHRRLDELAEMLYARTDDREPKNAKIHRSRSERIGPRGQAR
jgi:predicted ATP-grasp superfamily ATP-dependent carboligase